MFLWFQLRREREERNYYQLERDRLTTFWEVGKRQLEEIKSESRVKDRELEEAEERHQAEIKVRIEVTAGRCNLSKSAKKVKAAQLAVVNVQEQVDGGGRHKGEDYLHT